MLAEHSHIWDLGSIEIILSILISVCLNPAVKRFMKLGFKKAKIPKAEINPKEIKKVLFFFWVKKITEPKMSIRDKIESRAAMNKINRQNTIDANKSIFLISLFFSDLIK